MATDLDEQVSDFILRVTDAMGLTLASSIDEFPDHVRVNLSGDDADVLVRKKGEALDALQVIVNTAFGREARGDRHYVVDALGFRQGKDDELRLMARQLMDKVKSSGAPQEIGPLNPYARRIVHMTVTEDAALASASTGDDFLKVVVISKK
jgi:spoIIIJ-associated protein